MPIEFRILGPLEASTDGRLLPLGSPRQRALLALLLVHANETVARDRLIDELWAESTPATVESALHVYLSRLRRLLDSAGAGGALVREAHGYRLRTEPDQLDANRFERLVGEGSKALAAGKPDVAVERLQRALALWRGPALADLQSEPFASAAAARLEDQRISALEQRLEADLALGRDHELIGELEPLVGEHPYRERLRAQLMLALYRSGRQVDALRVYQEARRTLADELGLEPGQELKELEQAILRQDQTLMLEQPAKPRAEPELPPPPSATGPPAREERKVVTVLCADLVGVTAQAEQLDPEDVRAIQDRHWAAVRAEIERHGGTVEKFVGDAVMAIFGAPRAHEDDAERAVRTALAIREWALEGDVDLRVAVATGEALVTIAAGDAHAAGIIAGDVVNTASRMQAAAPPNAILVGEQTYRLTRDVVDYREAEPVAAKGKAHPIPVWQAVAHRSAVGVEVVQRGRTELIGRERELALLGETLARIRTERSPQLVTLVGAPGIGKSRLTYELFESVVGDRNGVRWRQGRCLPYGDGAAFWAIGEIVKSHADVSESDTAEEAETKLRTVVAELISEGDEAAWVERELRLLVGLSESEPRGENRLAETFAAWRRFFEALGEQAPLVLVVEDLHWADDDLLDFVDHLVDWASGVPILVLCTARPELLERRPAWGGGKLNAATIALAPLSDEETARLLTALIQRPLLPAETQSLLAHAGGNPLYAEQYARIVAERRDGDDLDVPPSVHGIIAARLDALSPAEKDLLQSAAVLGKVFWVGALASMSGTVRSEAEERLHTLERKEFVRRERRSSVAGESEYAFRHVLVRDVAYGQIPRAARSARHRKAAEWIEGLTRDRDDHVELLAEHYGQALELARASGDTDDLAARARRAFREAGDRLFGLNVFANAMRWYARALELWPERDHERPRLLLRLGQSLRQAEADSEEVLGDAREALLLATDVEGAAEAEAALGELYWDRGGGIAAAEHVERAATLLEDAPASAEKAYVLSALSRILTFTGNHERAVAVGREAIELAERFALDRIQAHALDNVGCARMTLGDAGGIDDLERSIELALAASAFDEAVRAYNNLGQKIRAGQGVDPDEERGNALLEEGRRLAERIGSAQWIYWFGVHERALLFEAGRWDELLARPDADDWWHARVGIGRGDHETARASAERELERARRHGRPDFLSLALALNVLVLAECGATAEAKRLAAELVAVLPEAKRLDAVQETEVLALVDLGHTDAVLRALGEGPLPRVEEALRLYAAGELVEAADAFSEIGDSGFLEAYARLRAAERLLAESKHGEADAQLHRSLEFWRKVDATNYIEQAERLLKTSA
jgi:DNA-binding SARP family transcriptional activator